MNDGDLALLKRFVRKADQSAFSDLVRLHLDIVFATALRKVGELGAAQEVAQNVFAALARKAWQFSPGDSLPAWLHRTTLLESKQWLRGELRRRRREQTAAALGTTMKTPDYLGGVTNSLQVLKMPDEKGEEALFYKLSREGPQSSMSQGPAKISAGSFPPAWRNIFPGGWPEIAEREGLELPPEPKSAVR